MGQCQEGTSAWWTIECQKSKVEHEKLKTGENKTQNMPVSLSKSIRDDRLEGGKHSTVRRDFFFLEQVLSVALQSMHVTLFSTVATESHCVWSQDRWKR